MTPGSQFANGGAGGGAVAGMVEVTIGGAASRSGFFDASIDSRWVMAATASLAATVNGAGPGSLTLSAQQGGLMDVGSSFFNADAKAAVVVTARTVAPLVLAAMAAMPKDSP